MRGYSSSDQTSPILSQLMCHQETVQEGLTGGKQQRCSLFVLYSTEESTQGEINDKYITMLYSISVVCCV